MKMDFWKSIRKTICLVMATTLCLSGFSACNGLPDRSYSTPTGDSSLSESATSSDDCTASDSTSSSDDLSASDSTTSTDDSTTSDSASSSDSSVDSDDSSEDTGGSELPTTVAGTHYNVVAISTHWGASNAGQITFRFSDVTDPTKSTVDLGYDGWVAQDDDTNAFKQYITVKGQALSKNAVLQGLDKKDGLCLSEIGTLAVGDQIVVAQGATFTKGDVSFTTAYKFTLTWNGTTYTESKTFENGIAFMQSKAELGVGHSASVAVHQQNATNVTYQSSNPAVASVDEQTGKVTANALGSVRIQATATVGGQTKQSAYTVKVQPQAYTALNGQEECVRYVGRTFTNSRGVNCYTTASGIAVNFYGTQLKATITSTGISLPRLCVLVDGETDCTARMVDLTKTTSTAEYTLVQGLTEGYHTVYVYKVTEAYMTALAFSALKTDGYLMDKPLQKKYQFEVYGDSITAGLHNMKPVGTADPALLETDNMQNGCMTYAFKTAQAFDADLHVMARSGIGAYSAWGTPNPLNTAEEMSMLNMWNRSYVSDVDRFGGTYTNPEWDFSHYKPDLVIINIGTNDVWHNWNETTYKTALTTLCNNLFAKYGNDLKIVLVSGMMVTDNTSAMQQVQSSLALQDKAIIHVQLNQSTNGHPDRNAHQTASEGLTTAITQAFGHIFTR